MAIRLTVVKACETDERGFFVAGDKVRSVNSNSILNGSKKSPTGT